MTDERGFERTNEIRMRRNKPSNDIIGIEQKWVRYRRDMVRNDSDMFYAEIEWREVETA